MSVLNRKMFGRRYAMGGPVRSSRGVGITSGLVPRYSHGGPVTEHVTQDYETYFNLLKGVQGDRPEFDRGAANTPALLALSSALMSGKSLQGGAAGALDIGGQALEKATPYFAEAIAARKAYDAADPESDLRMKALEMAIENQPKAEKRLTREFPLDVNKIQNQESYDGGTTWSNVGVPYDKFKPAEGVISGKLTRENPLPNNQIQLQSYNTETKSWENLGNPYDRYKTDSTSKRLTRELAVEGNKIQDQESYDGGTNWTNVGAVRDKFAPKKDETKRLTRSVAGEDNTLQDQESYDGGQNWTDVGVPYDKFRPNADTPTKLITRSVNIGDGMIQDQQSRDNGENWTDVGTQYPRFKPTEKDGQLWKYNSTLDKEVVRNGKTYKQTIALFSRGSEGDDPEWKNELIFEEEIIPDQPKRSASGNIVIKSGPNKGKTFGAIEFQNGTIKYYDPFSEGADARGLVSPQGEFEFFTSSVVGDKESVLGDKGREDTVKSVANLSTALATGANLLDQALLLGNDLDTFQTAILKKGGSFLGQFGEMGDEARQALYDAFDSDPEALDKFLVQARQFVAQMISPLTGEGTSRISEPEREMTNQALGLFNGMNDSQSAIAAIEAAIAMTYVTQHRNLLTLDTPDYLSVYDPSAEQAVNIDGGNFHISRLQAMGLTPSTIKSTIERMRDMEMLGLNYLKTLDQKSHFEGNKTDITNQYNILKPPQ